MRGVALLLPSWVPLAPLCCYNPCTGLPAAMKAMNRFIRWGQHTLAGPETIEAAKGFASLKHKAGVRLLPKIVPGRCQGGVELRVLGTAMQGKLDWIREAPLHVRVEAVPVDSCLGKIR